MEQEQGDGWELSVCGLNCARCRTRESGECQGCRGPVEKHHSPGCAFWACAKERGHSFCFECEAFPCESLESFENDGHKHHQLAVGHLKRIKEVGIEQWKKEQPQVMFCPGWFF